MGSRGFVHQIDPILGEFAGFYLWWYGLAYSIGFLGVYLWLSRARQRLGLTLHEVYSLCILFALGILLGGRAVEVIFYEPAYYLAHPAHILFFWLGGMSTHGVLAGAIAGTFAFCRLYKKSFLTILDALAIPGAVFMGLGRIGNFTDGQIVGRVTEVWWAVQFPDAEGFRHPVVLYDSLKNFLLIPLLLWVRARRPVPGRLIAHFIFWYGFLRIFVDIFREYPTTLLGIATGQSFNISMALVGIGLFVWLAKQPARVSLPAPFDPIAAATTPPQPVKLWTQRVLFALLLLFPLIIPSDWTQDVPARYGKRHPGLRHSSLYPPIRP